MFHIDQAILKTMLECGHGEGKSQMNIKISKDHFINYNTEAFKSHSILTSESFSLKPRWLSLAEREICNL